MNDEPILSKFYRQNGQTDAKMNTRFKEVRVTLCLIMQYAIKIYGGDIISHTYNFGNVCKSNGQLHASVSFTPCKHLVGNFLGFRASRDSAENTKKTFLLEIEPRFPGHHKYADSAAHTVIHSYSSYSTD